MCVGLRCILLIRFVFCVCSTSVKEAWIRGKGDDPWPYFDDSWVVVWTVLWALLAATLSFWLVDKSNNDLLVSLSKPHASADYLNMCGMNITAMLQNWFGSYVLALVSWLLACLARLSCSICGFSNIDVGVCFRNH